jgi:hypothetical protein
MQAVLVDAVIVLGKLAFGLPGVLPAEYWISSLVRSALILVLASAAAAAAVVAATTAVLDRADTRA